MVKCMTAFYLSFLRTGILFFIPNNMELLNEKLTINQRLESLKCDLAFIVRQANYCNLGKVYEGSADKDFENICQMISGNIHLNEAFMTLVEEKIARA